MNYQVKHIQTRLKSSGNISTVSNNICSFFFAIFMLTFLTSFSQNQTAKWYFGKLAGLDFMTSPPNAIPNASMSVLEAVSSMADPSGNTLFYTDGDTVFNKNNLPMVNGTGLFGHESATQGALIVKQPGNANIYFIFTLDAFGESNGLRYSIVDMNLGSGLGAVTSKNVLLNTPSCEKLAAVRHCNGIDIWVVSHDFGSNAFRSYLLTATGINPNAPVISNIGPAVSHSLTTIGQMKISPDGKKLGFVIHDVDAIGYNATLRPVEIFDFNSSTGVISNQMSLQSFYGSYGCEFSPDGSKFYVSNSSSFASLFSPFPIYYIFQWDLCAGTATAVANSIYTITIPSNTGKAHQLQLAQDGKIYIARSYGNIGCITSPNMAAAACNYSNIVHTFSLPSIGTLGLPNMMASYLKTPPIPFTFTSVCSSVNFSAPQNTFTSGCSFASNPVLSSLWNFGDQNSAITNTSNLANPSHTYSSPGTYTVKLTLNYTCSADTIILPVTVSGVSFSVSGGYTVCPKDKRIYTASGATSYSWSTGANTPTVALTTSVNTTYTVTGFGPSPNACKLVKTFQVTVNKCTSIEDNTNHKSLIRVFPNPTNDFLQIETTLPINITIKNTIGQLIYTAACDMGRHSFDMSKFDNGIYFLEASGGEGSQVFRLVKTD